MSRHTNKLTLYRDGEPCDGFIRTGSFRFGFETVQIIGKTLDGRVAVVAAVTLPCGFVDAPGKCYTGGTTWEMRREGA